MKTFSSLPRFALALIFTLLPPHCIPLIAAPASGITTQVQQRIATEYPSLFQIYTNLHAHPELSFMEIQTAALVARELRAAGFQVTEKVGNTGVVGVLTNGPGLTILFRADMDGLPIKETSGVPYASTDIVKDLSGKDQPAMHGCAHDAHITSLIGTARLMASLKQHWSGTLILIAQPAEEIVGGARAMLADGLYTRFPKPDRALALHVSSLLPAGMIGYGEGPFMASVNSMDILVRGVGGHGSMPHATKDPVVLASQIVLALQTIVSREIKPGDTAVVTVGTIHGGLKRNIIPEEVKLELTLRAFDDKVMQHLIDSIKRICSNLARAAGMPEDRLPVITLTPESVPVTHNDPILTRKVVRAFESWFDADQIRKTPPVTGAEDFSEFRRQGVPICMWWVGATGPDQYKKSERTGIPVPSNHSPAFAPLPEPTLQSAVKSSVAALLDLLQPKP